EDLPQKYLLAVTNFPPRQIANFRSEVLILGVVVQPGDVVLIEPDQPVPLGQRVL
ncbi:MAG: tRNA-binding protein, partial [Cyanobacteria bacterium P01_H01_bin.121]